MKILHVGTFSCPNAEYISESFRSLGHTVKDLEESSCNPSDVLAEINKGYDLLFCEEGRLKGDHVNADPDGFRNVIHGYFKEVMVIPTVSWLTNIFFGIMRREIELETNPIFQADIVFSTDGGHQKEFEEKGINHVPLRQGIFLPEAYLTDEKYDTKAEIGFVGGIYPWMWKYRPKLLSWLSDTYGERFGHFGDDGRLRHHALNTLVQTLKINIGDSVYSPHYWSNRIYEIIGRGGFLIHPMIEGLEEEFTPYKHFIPYQYGDFDGLKEKIDYYLTHDSERDKIRLAGFEHCKKYHTYQNRVKKLVEVLTERGIV